MVEDKVDPKKAIHELISNPLLQLDTTDQIMAIFK